MNIPNDIGSLRVTGDSEIIIHQDLLLQCILCKRVSVHGCKGMEGSKRYCIGKKKGKKNIILLGSQPGPALPGGRVVAKKQNKKKNG